MNVALIDLTSGDYELLLYKDLSRVALIIPTVSSFPPYLLTNVCINFYFTSSLFISISFAIFEFLFFI